MVIFPSLHTHTEYSFLESSIRIDSLISFALENKLEQLAITDHNNMFGVAEFVHKCKANGIKPIIGVDLDVEDFRLILLAKNYEGYKDIVKWTSMKAKGIDIKTSDISDRDIFIIDHPTKGYFAKRQRQLHFNNYFIATDENISNAIFVKETNTLKESDGRTLAILKALRENTTLNENDIKHTPYVFKGDINNAAIKQALIIAKECNVVFPKDISPLPKYLNPNKVTSVAYLKNVVQENAKTVLADIQDKTPYIERIKYEMSIIEKLGFADYFLIIWDLIKWSKENQILIGPGRGSSAGSLISYILNITEIDPLKHGLLFERFLNPERVTMPDIDIDIQDNRRDEVIKYLFEKYSDKNVGLISTVSKLAAKSALRDVARAMGLSVSEAIELTKLIKDNQTLTEAYNESPRFRAAINRTELATKLYHNALQIEGLPRQHGTHAAGIVISNRPLEEVAPTILSNEGLNQIQYSMEYLEENGLLKIDLLALTNLTTLIDIQNEIFKTYKKYVDIKKIPLNDKLTNELLTSADTSGIFQLESHGMKQALKLIGVSSLDDVVAIISLFRPGPMDTIENYAAQKQGKIKFEPIAKEYDAIVKQTHGSMIYQEQIMQVAQDFAGMSFGQADILRRAISKKNYDEIEKLKDSFFKGASEKGYSKETINKVYEMIEKFANYGFNKSHAVAYATLSYRMAFLKARFPFEFYTALLATSVGSSDKIKTYVIEAKNKKINVVAPNINQSRLEVFNDKGNIVLPLVIIKGFGEVAAKKVDEEKQKGPFKDFFELVMRLRNAGLGEQNINHLILANALRDFGNMQTLSDALPQALRYADMCKSLAGDKKDFDFSLLPKPKLVVSERDIEAEVRNEVNAYGFNLFTFETTKWEKKEKLVDLKEGKDLTVIAKVVHIKEFTDKNNNKYAKIELLDSSTSLEAYAFWDVYKFIEKTKQGKIVEVSLSARDKGFNIIKPWKEITNG